jgi:hypothetical protein
MKIATFEIASVRYPITSIASTMAGALETSTACVLRKYVE